MIIFLHKKNRQHKTKTQYSGVRVRERRKMERKKTYIERKLNTCKPTAFVAARRIGLRTTKNLINALPDGYPIPMKSE